MQHLKSRLSQLRIVIIGSGVSSANCALTLRSLFGAEAPSRLNIKILEANSIPFGRMRQSNEIHPEAEIDIGGEIIHGESEMKNLMDKIIEDENAKWKSSYPQSSESPDIRLVEMFDLKDPEAMSFFYTDAKNCKEKRTLVRSLINLLEAEFEEYVEENLPRSNLKNVSIEDTFKFLIDRAVERDPSILTWVSKDILLKMLDARFGKTFGALNLKSLGTSDIAMELNSLVDDDSVNLVSSKGYGILRDFFLREIGDVLHLNEEVVEIKYMDDNKNPIQISCLHHPTNTKKIEYADIVVVGVPLSILQRDKIKFVPALPELKVKAINQLQMSFGAKIFATFNNAKEVYNRWEEKFDKTSLVFTADDEYIAQVWLSYVPKNSSQMVITGFTTGDRAGKLSELSTHEVEIKFKQLLSNMLGEDIVNKNYSKIYIQDWSKDPYIQGSYSCETIGSYGSRRIIAEDIDERIYFIGEHCCSTAPATVHGAMRSGQETAHEIFNHHSRRVILQSKF